jgi:hypothetical protein
MRKELIAIGILAMIAVCATLAMAAPSTPRIIVSDDNDQVVLMDLDGVTCTITIAGTEYFRTPDDSINYVPIGNCDKIETTCSQELECIELDKGTYNVIVSCDVIPSVEGKGIIEIKKYNK